VLHIGAANSAYYVWVNGKPVGYSEDSKLPSGVRRHPYLRPGKNNVSIEIYRWSDGSYSRTRTSGGSRHRAQLSG
jgi:beta-galactosidase